MPCRDYESDNTWYQKELEGQMSQLRELLCEACHIADETQMSGPLATWWAEHKAEDERRRAEIEEQKKLKRLSREAMKKLTPEDIEALRFTGIMKK